MLRFTTLHYIANQFIDVYDYCHVFIKLYHLTSSYPSCLNWFLELYCYCQVLIKLHCGKLWPLGVTTTVQWRLLIVWNQYLHKWTHRNVSVLIMMWFVLHVTLIQVLKLLVQYNAYNPPFIVVICGHILSTLVCLMPTPNSISQGHISWLYKYKGRIKLVTL